MTQDKWSDQLVDSRSVLNWWKNHSAIHWISAVLTRSDTMKYKLRHQYLSRELLVVSLLFGPENEEVTGGWTNLQRSFIICTRRQIRVLLGWSRGHNKYHHGHNRTHMNPALSTKNKHQVIFTMRKPSTKVFKKSPVWSISHYEFKQSVAQRPVGIAPFNADKQINWQTTSLVI